MTANRAWVALLRALGDAPVVAPRGRQTRELVSQSVRVSASRALLTVPERRLNYRFAAAEALWMVLGRSDVAPLARVNPKMRDFSDDGATLAGAYGPRFRQQLDYVLDALKSDAASRQAVVEIWRPCPRASKDIPCTLSWQFLLRDSRLHMVATMRSSDAWLGVPYDLFSFAVVQSLVAGFLGAEPGSLTINAGSSHLYEADWERAQDIDDRYPGHKMWHDAWPVHTLALAPMTLDEFGYLETVANRILDKGALVHGRPLPAGWDRLLEAVCAKTSAEALEVLVRG